MMSNNSSTKSAGKLTAKNLRAHFKLTLFWKVLGWFWLTMMLVLTIYLFVGYINGGKAHFRELPPPIEKQLRQVTHKAKSLLRNSTHRHVNLHNKLNKIYLLDAHGKDFLDREIPELLSDLHSRVKRHNKTILVHQNNLAFFGGKKIQFKEIDYWIYMSQKEAIFNRLAIKNFFRDSAITLLLSTLIVSFPISFLLSWLITRPIRQLQLAVNDIQLDLSNKNNLQKLNKRSDEFGELARDFDHMAIHLAALLKAQKQLLSDVSHELRSPLARLQIALGLIAQQNNDNDTPDQQALARIKLEAARMNNMLENLLTLTKLDSQEASANKEQFDLTRLFTQIIDDARFEAAQANIEFILQLPDQCAFFGIKESMFSGIENILRNAIRYAGENTSVTCQLSQIDNQVYLNISDNGKGVDDEQLIKLFDPFYRAQSDRARASGGVGLGLSIAKRAFALNGGEISAQNILPHGLKISVIFTQ